MSHHVCPATMMGLSSTGSDSSPASDSDSDSASVGSDCSVEVDESSRTGESGLLMESEVEPALHFTLNLLHQVIAAPAEGTLSSGKQDRSSLDGIRDKGKIGGYKETTFVIPTIKTPLGDMVKQWSNHSRARVALDPPRCETHDLKDIIEHCPQHSLVESDSSDSCCFRYQRIVRPYRGPVGSGQDAGAADVLWLTPPQDQGNRAVYVVEEPAEPHADDDGLEADLSELVMASEINRSAAESRINRAHEEVKKMKSAVVALDEEFSRIKIKLEKAVAALCMPNYTLALINLVQHKVARLLQEQSWVGLQQRSSGMDSLVRYIKQQLEQRNIRCSLSADSLATVCNFHIGTLCGLERRSLDTPVECDSRQFLEDAYLFSYGASIEADEFTE
ncbi:hypothetical protein F5141DRAFT_1062200 [Pisolithus sp. B1]|nr:hypothetical protein F5141DRAFT_1062200 [Pisolithus sp. B1]